MLKEKPITKTDVAEQRNSIEGINSTLQLATCSLDFDSLPTLPRRQAGGQAGAQSTVKPATCNIY
ncbi:MAG: hypothetical protein A2275_10280 [Bacteroidetes bacterium RIFOXYA12_FULL_35_11]|nr:MAG: hypothetical protein A2X01_10580 [Bacteroidetes bacterium GWF2_35_48]OFY74679.1 MAG: hypothetical protein A2275_10280 [Bacteroidetes bacterium RIFOXYA12_FULL_35_11]OFZ02220.1 MAG: hypothetical protein A2491_04590 [Bacteroidetes bacterium RIFOXYC12_FULL_35_7]HBX49905.1 hypothetical protein [Bacteroidales bacterium]